MHHKSNIFSFSIFVYILCACFTQTGLITESFCVKKKNWYMEKYLAVGILFVYSGHFVFYVKRCIKQWMLEWMRQIWHEDLSPCFSKSCLYEINQLVLQWVWIENILSSACLSMRLLLTTGKQRTMWEWFTSTPTRTCLCLFCNLHFKTRKKELDSIAHTTCHSLLSPFSASASFFLAIVVARSEGENPP